MTSLNSKLNTQKDSLNDSKNENPRIKLRKKKKEEEEKNYDKKKEDEKEEKRKKKFSIKMHGMKSLVVTKALRVVFDSIRSKERLKSFRSLSQSHA